MKPVLVSKYVDLLNKAYSKYRDVKVIYRAAGRETCNSNFFSNNHESSASENKNICHRKSKRRSKDTPFDSKKNKGLMSAVHFNPNEDLIILEALKKEKDVGVVIRKLKIELKRSYRSIQHRIVKLQSGSSRRETKTFSLAEDLKIIDNAVESIRYGQTLSRCEIAKVDDLAANLNREAKSINSRWNLILRPWLLQYFKKTLNLDIRPMLINHLAANFTSIRDIDWKTIEKMPEFSGHTIESIKNVFLKSIHLPLSRLLKIPRTEVTLRQLADASKSYHFSQITKEKQVRQKEIIDYFVSLVSSHNLKNFV